MSAEASWGPTIMPEYCRPGACDIAAVLILAGLWLTSSLTVAAQTTPPKHPAGASTSEAAPERSRRAIQPEFFGMTIGGGPRSAQSWPGDNGIAIGTLGKSMSGMWPFVERYPGSYHWTPLDRVIAQAHRYGIKSIVYTFLGVPSFEASDPDCAGLSRQPICPGPPRSQQDFLKFVTALVMRYKGQITAYEMWNEGNRPMMWKSGVAELAELQQPTYRTIKSIDPQAKVLTASPVLAPNFASWLKEYFENIRKDGTVFADGVSWHAYHCADQQVTCFQGTSCDQNPLDCAGTPLVNQIATVRKTEGDAGIDLPLYDTEGGWQQNRVIGDDPRVQAAYISRWYIIQASEGVATAIWYGWGTGGGRDPETGCPTCANGWGGIFDQASGRPTLAAAAYETTYHWLVGSTMDGPCSADASDVWTCGLTLSNGRPALIVWNGSETAGSYKAPPRFVQYVTLASPTPRAISAGGSVTINAEPTLLLSEESVEKNRTTD
jgi:hypothetical protein